MKNHSFANQAVVRTPLSVKKIDITWEEIQEIFKVPKHREALFIGSPNIFKALELWEKGEAFQTEDELKNLKGSLYKYTSRLANRCTPFGLWASVSTISLAKETNIDVAGAELKRTTKFDMYFLGEILPEITKHKEIRDVLKYYPNNSMYKVMDKYRFVEYYFKDQARCHKISEVDINDYLEKTIAIAQKGATINELIKPITDDNISTEDARAFINQVIDSQFFVNELEFTLTGDDYLESLLDVLTEKRFDFYEANVVKKLLLSLKSKIRAIDASVCNSPEKYRDIHKEIEKEIQEADITKLFQVDSFKDLSTATLSYNTVKKLRSAIVVLNKLQSKRENPTLDDFKTKFQERYEEYEQPLINVLDPDLGIGYGRGSGAKTPLVDKLAIRGKSATSRQINWSKKTGFLFKKALHALQHNVTEISLTDDEINQFKENEALYPDSFSTFFNVFHENGEEKVCLKSVWGPSANGLIGRFAHLDDSIETMCNEIQDYEKALYPDKILAEIIHLPQARTGNILYRKFQRDYEIPYLGNSSLDKEHQLDVADLYVSVRRGKIILRSKRLNKEIIPRLGNAHNYSANALPIYHFLCDLQDQEQSGLSFSWGSLQHEFDYLPRVSYKDIVLSRATWTLNHDTIKTILDTKEEDVISYVRAFRKERNIPNVVAFTQGDNEVVVNFENDLSCTVFFFMLKGERMIQLKEFFFEEDTITGAYCNEFVLPSYKNAPKASDLLNAQPLEAQKGTLQKASYSTGDEWLYYKFYCGERVGEKLLNHAIKPIVDELEANNLIDKWFFIRYGDKDGHHLRFRIHLNDQTKFSQCVFIIKKHIQPFENNLLIWKTQTDTYLRELQRYGFDSIDATEELYYNDSEATVKFADLIEGDAGERVRWLFSLLSMDHLLNDFGFDVKQKMQLLNVAKTGFGKEFNKTGALNKQVNELYSENMSNIEAFLDEDAKADMYAPLWDILKERSVKNKVVVDQLKELAEKNILPGGLQNTVLSYLHMVCNRIFLAKQRVHEMVVYDMLFKYYSKQLHTQKKSKTKVTA
ncbi:lantibiotic dehydratase [Lacinutrix sp. Hel_I_90]|uniref:lantibiotic dehydratase n=1 Tax=Lacinutrix sp. Hel_I_90 TaxID=1249999 RepID=UPI0005CAE862|nr:lantibiotic dehydratase [Lacinutrix sp. Hel_I_90]